MKKLMENWRKYVAETEAEVEEAKNKDGKEQGADGKACWKGYKHAGTDEDGKDKCVPMEEGENLQEYGDHETQAQGGMVSSSHSSDPELDHIADIVRTVIEQGGGLHDLKQPLEAEAYDVSATNRFIIVKTTNGDIGIASAKNVELTGGEELIDTPYGQLAVGRINQLEESGCSDDEDEEALEEETDKDRMACNKPRYIKKGEPGYGDKQKVVKACDGDKEKIIRFGDANMENKSDNKDSKANFRSRHSCEDKKDKMSAGYWSCKDW